jgi:hypothetical protein
MKALDHFKKTGGDTSYLSQQDREYLEAWDTLTEEQRAEMKAAGINGPMLDRQGPVNHSADDVDPFATIPAPGAMPGEAMDAAEPTDEGDAREMAAQAVLRVLYTLTGSRHPGLRLSTDCLLAIINRTEEKSQAAIARKYGLTRAAVSKRMRDMRKGSFLGGLEIFFFGGREDVSEASRARAIRVHNKRKENTQCKQKPSPFAI